MSAERPQREVAYRLFAAEFEDADFTYAESDEERAPNYVVTPTGARVNRMFVVGVLTEVEQVSDDVLRARIVDPTGAFVVYAGQYQPEAMAFFDRAEPPAFVAVTGKARTFQPDDSDVVYTSIRPESANEVTAETRDRWVVQTAEQTLDRIETFAGAVDLAERGDALTDALARRGIRPGLAAGIPKAMDHYGTTTGYLAEMRRVAIDAARVVANDLDEVASPEIAPDEGADRELVFEASLPESEFASGREPRAVDADSESGAPPTADETVPADDEADTESSADEAKPADGEVEPSADEATPADEEADTESAPETDAESTRAADSESEPEVEASKETPTEASAEPETDESATADETTATADEAAAVDEVEPDEMYELSEEEREEVESEYGVDFATGNEIQEPGEADIETPDAEEATAEATAAEPADETAEQPVETEPEPETAEEPATTEEEDTAEDAETTESDAGSTGPSSDVDLEDAVVDTMAELDDGDGAPRDELVETVADEYGASPADVEDAIQDALMGGRCYESGENRITPI